MDRKSPFRTVDCMDTVCWHELVWNWTSAFYSVIICLYALLISLLKKLLKSTVHNCNFWLWSFLRRVCKKKFHSIKIVIFQIHLLFTLLYDLLFNDVKIWRNTNKYLFHNIIKSKSFNLCLLGPFLWQSLCGSLTNVSGNLSGLLSSVFYFLWPNILVFCYYFLKFYRCRIL